MLCYLIISVLTLFLPSIRTTNVRNDQVPLAESACDIPSYSVHLLSKNPLVIYLPNFLTAKEAAHVQAVTYVWHLR